MNTFNFGAKETKGPELASVSDPHRELEQIRDNVLNKVAESPNSRAAAKLEQHPGETEVDYGADAVVNSTEILPKTLIKETVREYAAAGAREVLAPHYAITEQEAQAITLELSPEPHDRKIEELVTILLDKGIKNTLTVVEKLNDPHLMDDFHRFLVQFIASGHTISDLRENTDLWKTLHMALFEVSLPEVAEADKDKKLKELVSGMEQFYLAMLSIVESLDEVGTGGGIFGAFGGGRGKQSRGLGMGTPGWFSIEIANANGSEEFVFYVALPAVRRELFEKQVLAIFHGSHIKEHKDDYNIFNEGGVTVGSYAELDKHALYPLKTYEAFDIDPLGAILNSFSKIDRDGEGAALQIVVGGRRNEFSERCKKALEKIRKGKKVKEALEETEDSVVKDFTHAVTGLFKTKEKIDKEKEDESKRSGALDTAMIELFNRKLKSPFVGVNMRIIASAASADEAMGILSDLESSFNQFEEGSGNRIKWVKVGGNSGLSGAVGAGRGDEALRALTERFSLRSYVEKEEVALNIEELTSCAHFPATKVFRAAPQLKQSKSGTAPAPLEVPAQGTLLGINKHRGEDKNIYISPEDRMRHFYVIGQTGTGKTTLLKNMIVQDIQAGNGVCFIDPHGSDVMEILANVPPSRYQDVIYFDPASVDRPMALNMLEYDRAHPEQKTFVVNEMFSIFQKLYGAVPESMGPMFEQYFRNATMLVIEDPESGCTLLDVSRVMSNKAFRDMKISKCKNPVVVQFWKEIAEKAGGEASLANVVPYITSKFDVFLSNEIMRPIIAQEKSAFNMRDVMDGRKILLVNLSKGRLGDINSHLIGLILVGKILMAALSRVDSFGKNMADFFLYLDEFQNITTDSIATILSEARKYRLSLNIAHQFIAQLDDKIKNSVFGNVGSMAIYRVGTEDAEFLVKQLAPVFTAQDIVNINNFNAYVRLLAGGRPARPFSMETMPPNKGNVGQVDKLRELSSLMFGRPRPEVEAEIMAKYSTLKPGNLAAKS